MSSFNIKRVLIGNPFPTSFDIHERLDKVRGLAIFASDPISSNAYATEAIMSVLILIGVSALQWTMPIAIAIGMVHCSALTPIRMSTLMMASVA